MPRTEKKLGFPIFIGKTNCIVSYCTIGSCFVLRGGRESCFLYILYVFPKWEKHTADSSSRAQQTLAHQGTVTKRIDEDIQLSITQNGSVYHSYMHQEEKKKFSLRSAPILLHRNTTTMRNTPPSFSPRSDTIIARSTP